MLIFSNFHLAVRNASIGSALLFIKSIIGSLSIHHLLLPNSISSSILFHHAPCSMLHLLSLYTNIVAAAAAPHLSNE
jgi:hypothetical protein